MTDWTEKYRPTTLTEVRGNDKAREQLRKWAETWPEHRTAVILHGSPGVGKTSAAHALATDMGWSTMELNASDQRTATVIDRIAGEAAKSGTLTHGGDGRRLIILDEADNFHGTSDYGGTRAVTRIIKEASQPIVLIANEYYDMSQGLRSACEGIEFRNISARSIVPVLRDICRKEGIEFEEDALEAIAENTSGDLRSAIKDLQAIAETNERLAVDAVVTGQRDRTKGIFEFLDDVFKEQDAQGALYSSYDVDETPDDLIRWIEDNLPKDYRGAELAEAYDALSRADRWLGRVRRTQEYRYWRYASDDMTAGVAASRHGPKGGWTRYGPPSYWSKLGRTRGTRNKRDYVARKIAETGGVSMGTARRAVLPYLARMTHHCTNRELTVRMAARYDLDADHVAFVTGSGAGTKKVTDIVDEAQRRRASIEPPPDGTGSTRSKPTDDGSLENDDQSGSGDAPHSDEEANEVTVDGDPESDEGDFSESQSGLSDFI